MDQRSVLVLLVHSPVLFIWSSASLLALSTASFTWGQRLNMLDCCRNILQCFSWYLQTSFEQLWDSFNGVYGIRPPAVQRTALAVPLCWVSARWGVRRSNPGGHSCHWYPSQRPPKAPPPPRALLISLEKMWQHWGGAKGSLTAAMLVSLWQHSFIFYRGTEYNTHWELFILKKINK